MHMHVHTRTRIHILTHIHTRMNALQQRSDDSVDAESSARAQAVRRGGR
jgi:hypothetical protein